MLKNLCFTVLYFLVSLPLTYTAHAEKIYSVGVVPQFEARRIAEIWQPILDEISQQSGIQLELMASSGIPVFEKQLAAGEFDFAYINPYHAIISNEKQGYAPLLRDTDRNLFGIIVVKKDSPFQSVYQLEGKTLAFPSPNALGATLLPRAELARKFDIKVDETYVKSHTSVYLNVILGKAAAGGGAQKTLAQQPKQIRDQLRVLYKTTEVPAHPIAAHPRVDNIIQDKIKTAFIELGNSEKGKNLLKNIPINTIGEASIEDYDPLKQMQLDEFYVGN